MEARRHVVVLLGAGASMDAGLPSSYQLTERMLDFLAQNHNHSLELAAAQFVYHILAAENARRRSPVEVDVERFVASVQLLGTRQTNPIAPFVDGWSGGVLDIETALDGVQQDAGRLVQAAAAQAQKDPGRYRGYHEAEQVGAQLIYLIQDVTGQRRRQSVFANLDRLLRRALFRLLAIDDPTATSYLKPLLTAALANRWTIATLNYDATVETCAAGLSTDVSTGVESWADEEQLRFRGDALNLIKLHGSIEWSMKREPRRDALTTTVVDVFKGASERPQDDEPAVIFGEGNKLSAEGPFLELFMEFSRRLSTADRLLLVGYSMRDPHVNEVIARWMNRSDDHRIVWLDPQLPVPGADWARVSIASAEAALCYDLLNFQHDNLDRVVLLSETAARGIASAIEQAAA